MASPLYNIFNNMVMNRSASNQNMQSNIIQQIMMIQSGQASILDILLTAGKINQQQYNQLQPYRNNPQQIYNILYNNYGYKDQLGQAEGQAQQLYSNFQQNFSPSSPNGGFAVN